MPGHSVETYHHVTSVSPARCCPLVVPEQQGSGAARSCKVSKCRLSLRKTKHTKGCREYDPFIHGLPGWKPWFGIGPVVRPILEHQAEYGWVLSCYVNNVDQGGYFRLKKLADAKNKSVDDDDVAQGDPPEER